MIAVAALLVGSAALAWYQGKEAPQKPRPAPPKAIAAVETSQAGAATQAAPALGVTQKASPQGSATRTSMFQRHALPDSHPAPQADVDEAAVTNWAVHAIEVRGALQVAALYPWIQQRFPHIERCEAAAATTQPSGATTRHLTLAVAATGRVEAAHLRHTNSAMLRDCVSRKTRRWQVPTQTAGIIRITYGPRQS
ncbi:MAG: hypothetical protein ACPGUV_00205 [Polyangiales bacterium]